MIFYFFIGPCPIPLLHSNIVLHGQETAEDDLSNLLEDMADWFIVIHCVVQGNYKSGVGINFRNYCYCQNTLMNLLFRLVRPTVLSLSPGIMIPVSMSIPILLPKLIAVQFSLNRKVPKRLRHDVRFGTLVWVNVEDGPNTTFGTSKTLAWLVDSVLVVDSSIWTGFVVREELERAGLFVRK
jgi:hypothetical protein